MKAVLQTMLSAYRLLISPIVGGLGCGCRFSPSCSAYAADALRVHPWPKAVSLIARRLLRCGPWSLGGFDPVK